MKLFKSNNSAGKTLPLSRQYLENCTIGIVHYEGVKICNTIELPWLDNKPFVSCVPPGTYELKPCSSRKHPNSYYLENHDLGVSLSGDTTRTGILIHIANFVSDIEGCIGPGLSLHPEKWGVSDSRKAMKKLNNLIGTNLNWTLKIT